VTASEPDRETLVDLIERTAGGSEPAFTELYSATCTSVYSQVNRVVQNSSMAAEVTQEVYVDLWRHAQRYDHNIGSVMAWLLTIARRRAIDRVRHEERVRRLDTRYVTDHPADEIDVFESVDRTMNAEHIRMALRGLSDRQHQAVELAYIAGYANVEIADLLGIPVGTTKTRIRDGLTRLQAMLHEQSWLAPHRAAYESSTRRRTQAAR
jgi:RNA polymerase sigma-70 factor (ECF subfamily)